MSPPIRNKIIQNTLYSVIGRSWTIIVGVVLAPYIISKVGIDRFGIWSLLSVLVGYFALFDLGIGLSFTRFISEAYTKSDHEEINRIANSGFVFYLLLILPVLGVAYVGRESIFGFLNINQTLYPDSLVAYYGTLLIFLLSTTFSGFTSILQGIQKIDIVNKIGLAVTIPNAVATIFFLKAGLKLDGLMWTSLLSSILGLLLSIFFAKNYLPALRFNPFLFSSETMKRLLGYGLKIQFSKFAEIVTFQTDKIIVSYFSGIGAVGLYQVGTQIVWRTRDIPVLMLSSLLPAASELHTLNDTKKLMDIYERGTKYLAVVSIPLLLFLAATAQVLMRAWMGQGYSVSAELSQILCVGYLCNVLVGVGVTAAAGMNQPNFQWHSAIAMTFTNIVFVIVLGYFFGIYGIAIASTVSLVVGSFYFLVKFHKYLRMSILKFMGSTMAIPFAVSLLLSIALWASNKFILESLSYSGRAPYAMLLALEALFFVSFYLYFVIKFRYFDDVDRELFLNNYLLSKLQRMVGR